ncbi:MAG: oligosaccharide flippase family protein, partial [FCB group bacterium]|nr:oligosaccharide flippase family protein [FCB group bacterium]
MNRSDSIFRNTAFIFIAKIIDLAAALAGFILVARYLGVDGLGRYSFVMAFVSVFGLVVNLGIDHIIIRESASSRQRLPVIIGAAIKLKVYLLMIMAPLLMGGLALFGLDAELKAGILLFAAALIVFREMFTIPAQAVFLGCERLEYRTITTFAFPLLRTGGSWVVLF